MFWKKNKVKEKKSLEEMYKPMDGGEDFADENADSVDFDEAKKDDCKKQPREKKPVAPIKPLEYCGGFNKRGIRYG